MRIGPYVRAWLGPLEHPVVKLYRHLFFDPGSLVRLIRDWAPAPERILEVGCGEGALLPGSGLRAGKHRPGAAPPPWPNNLAFLVGR